MTYVLSVVCDHSRQPTAEGTPSRVIARIGYFPRPEGRLVFGWLEWRELAVEDANYPRALQTYYGEARRLERSATEHAVPDLIPNMTEGQRWRFWCSDCTDTVPVRHSNMEKLLPALRDVGASSLVLAHLASTLT